jgi:tetratricopeptide (TPR) repeat protein
MPTTALEPTAASVALVEVLKVASGAMGAAAIWGFRKYFTRVKREHAKAEDLLCAATPELREHNLIHTDDVTDAVMQLLHQFQVNHEQEAVRIESSKFRQFKQNRLASYAYLFAIHCALSKQLEEANSWVDKSLRATEGWRNISKLPCLRWAARIKRLTRDETSARKYLTDVIALTRDGNDPVCLAKFYRSRGACCFNLCDFPSAASDFRTSIEFVGNLPENRRDKKAPYAHCGLAMSIYMMALYPPARSFAADHDMNQALAAYQRAISLEPKFFAENATQLRENLVRLEVEQKYYFSPMEKISMDRLREEFARRAADRVSA